MGTWWQDSAGGVSCCWKERRGLPLGAGTALPRSLQRCRVREKAESDLSKESCSPCTRERECFLYLGLFVRLHLTKRDVTRLRRQPHDCLGVAEASQGSRGAGPPESRGAGGAAAPWESAAASGPGSSRLRRAFPGVRLQGLPVHPGFLGLQLPPRRQDPPRLGPAAPLWTVQEGLHLHLTLEDGWRRERLPLCCPSRFL